MAALAQSAVVVNHVWKEGGTNSRRFLAKDVTLTLTGQGTLATNNIPASLFGMRKIVSVRDVRTDGSTLLLAAPSYTGTVILLSDGSGATIPDPTDVTDTVRLTVLGLD